MLRRYSILLAAAFLAGTGHAQSSAPETNDEDAAACLLIGHRWWGTAEETARIEAMPVPASFRSIMAGPGCGRFQLDKESLVEWHLSFGTERSAAEALAYLGRELTRGFPSVEAYPTELGRTWRALQPDIRRAAAIREVEGQSYSARSRYLRRSQPHRRFREVASAGPTFMQLAAMHFEAAAEFRSIDLLTQAERYFRAAVEGDRVQATFRRDLDSNIAGYLSLGGDTDRNERFGARIATLRAQITRSPDDMSSADAVIQRLAHPLAERLAEEAFSGGSDFCDFDGAGLPVEPLEAACRADDDLHGRITDHWLNRALLDLSRNTSENPSLGLAVRLLERERAPDAERRCCRRSAEEDLIRLHRAAAESNERGMEAAILANVVSEARERWGEALRELRRAEALTRAFAAPARFRRNAEAWLRIWQRGLAIQVLSGEEQVMPRASSDQLRYSTYLRRTLASLDAIASGADPGLPPS